MEESRGNGAAWKPQIVRPGSVLDCNVVETRSASSMTDDSGTSFLTGTRPGAFFFSVSRHGNRVPGCGKLANPILTMPYFSELCKPIWTELD